MTATPAFELLARPIQQILWDMRWPSLRPIQEDAIHKILDGEADLIISAQTAAGKTEAAFLPILSRIHEHPAGSVQTLYVGPLKALINDQFRRLERLCQRAEIPVHRWHGDVDASRKKALIAKPSGVLLITPESIESLMINRSTSLARMFRSLQFVVIDEIHTLAGSERGTHLRSLLFRLQRYVQENYRIVGLSATLGDAFPVYERWMRPDGDRPVDLINGPSGEKQLLYKIHAYTATKPRREDGQEDDAESNDMPLGLAEDMYEHFAGRKNLIFANSKSDVEQFADSLNARCRRQRRPEEFLVHHGNVSKEVREFTEREMQGMRPRTTVCSSTLELGIDIGNVTAVGQIDPPWSVGSQVQRLGRSGRGEDEPQCMRVYVREDELEAKAALVDRLYPKLLRAIAITELMLQDPPWVEPPQIDAFDLSTLTHQILSVLAETGGCQASEVFARLCSRGAFRAIDTPLFAGVLRSLGAHEIVEQMEQGDLILAPKGEAIVNHYSFYSAFASDVEYSVIFGSMLIGTLPALFLPQINDHFLLAGRRWQVVSVDDDRKEVTVKPARGKKPPRFFGGGGEIHPRVRQMMREVVLGDRPLSYLNATGVQLLKDARATAIQAGLKQQSIVPLSPSQCLWFTWTGTKIQRTLCLIADSVGLQATDRDIAIEFKAAVPDVIQMLQQALREPLDAESLATRLPAKQTRKLDHLIAVPLLVKSLAHDALDISGAESVIRALDSAR
ncbi:MAG: DEAD/DEAH box helicase [Planctomycetaceae bacterium]|nr:DEAD/DEAH box helicase [Planctomycetales bacterium]MCB9923055.1 DEAD/DEAH box helicase [Planctomycetaceae bacterium]